MVGPTAITETYKVNGYINSEDVVKALEYYKSLMKFSPPDAPNYYWAETLDAYKAGKVAMAMDYFAFFPGAVNADQNPNYYDKTGFFISPAGPRGTRHQHRRSRYVNLCLLQEPRNRQAVYEMVLCRNRCRKNGRSSVGSRRIKRSCNPKFSSMQRRSTRLSPPVFRTCRTFGRFPNTPELLEACQTRWNQVVIGSKSAKEALDEIARKA